MIIIIHLELRLKSGFVSFGNIVTHEKKAPKKGLAVHVSAYYINDNYSVKTQQMIKQCILRPNRYIFKSNHYKAIYSKKKTASDLGKHNK